jgi:two-component system response regulator
LRQPFYFCENLRMGETGYILYIDDDEDDYSLFNEALLKAGSTYHIRFVNSGTKALEFLSGALPGNQLPVLIILDINMPGMDGKDTLIAIQQLLGGNNIPTLFLSTHPMTIDVDFAQAKGVTVMAKPTTISKYEDIVKTILNTMVG